ncbi:phosphoribosylformylglycinamidine synthase [Enterobacter cloacae]|uniref:Phosphoribosylformylglycinamidine synthase n=1 Tax=Enterobacter cloacae TaxID=550 RepID=A0A377LUX7_ENTCL|nr:phosphoribosylformylglycinamidine synthase [Enterobacter cloacae]
MSSKTSSIVPQTLALGVCNGCQMMSNLRELIPGSEAWPRFVRNQSDRFEARFSLVEVTQSPSLLLPGNGRVADANRRFSR